MAASPASSFSGAAETVWEAASAQLPDFSVEVLPEVDSTNSELMRRARAGQAAPVLLVAEHQRAGRGRMGREWQSRPGDSLTFSLGLPLAPEDWSGLSLAVGLSLADALHERILLKWPNDLWLDGRKLGGVLIETASVGDRRYVVVGVGLNLALPPAEGLATAPAALTELLPGITAPEALARVGGPLVRAVLRFGDAGFAPFRTGYEARDALRGRVVRVAPPAGAPATDDAVEGTASGIAANGALLVQTAVCIKEVSSSEVSVRPQA